jgi:hypothetical protein
MKAFGFEQRRAEIIGRTIIPSESFNGLAGQQPIGSHFGYQVASTPWYSSLVMRLAILFVWFAPLFVHLRTFGGLSVEKKHAWLERLSESNNYAVRQMMALLKMCFCFAVIGNTTVLKHLEAYDFGAHNLPARKVS